MNQDGTDLEVAGRYAVITGAADGIGRALARQAAEIGMSLALADINEAGLKTLTSELEANGTRVMTRHLDVGSAEETERFARDVFAWASSPFALVFANAGIHGLTDGLRPDLATWNRVIDVNLKGAIHMISAFMGRLIDQDMPAQFVLTASQAAYVAAPGMSPYVATKHALWGLADCLRLELAQADTPVGVSIVAPSRVASGMTRPQTERMRHAQGDAAARAYEAKLIGPEPIAEIMLREARRRAFWIIPSHEPTGALLQKRVDDLIAAMPAGEIRP